MSETTRKLTAILFTDIVGFTALMRADEKKALNLLYYNRQLLEPIIKKHDGEILKEMGDGTLNSFPSAIEAVRCALDIQEMLDAVPALNLRIGVHIGDVIEEGDDIFGDGVNIASRIQDLAEPGGICISQAVYDSIQSQADIRADSIGKCELKGIEGNQEIYTLITKPELIQRIPEEGGKRYEIGEKHNLKGLLLSWIGGILLVSIISLQSALYFSKSTDDDMINSVAVFPFEMIKGDERWDFLKDHFSESLTFQLGSMKTLKIIDRLQIRKALNKYDEPKQAGLAELATEIGQDIGANLVLLGNYTIIEEEILIITKIVNSKTGETTPLIKKKYNLDDPFDMVNDLSEIIFNHLQKENIKNSQ